VLAEHVVGDGQTLTETTAFVGLVVNLRSVIVADPEVDLNANTAAVASVKPFGEGTYDWLVELETTKAGEAGEAALVIVPALNAISCPVMTALVLGMLLVKPVEATLRVVSTALNVVLAPVSAKISMVIVAAGARVSLTENVLEADGTTGVEPEPVVSDVLKFIRPL
jgi:hypothetical protein